MLHDILSPEFKDTWMRLKLPELEAVRGKIDVNDNRSTFFACFTNYDLWNILIKQPHGYDLYQQP